MLKNVIQTAIEPALALLPARMKSKKAVVMMLAIGLQESRFIHRRQIKGPARGLWQFESGGGVRGVLNFHTTAHLAKNIALERIGTADRAAIYNALEHDDVLAAVFARLLLWTDPRSLPVLGDVQAAWDLYLRTWRPGKPHRHTWDALYQQALKAVADYE
ncbi:hypothetical protein HX099_10495 [Thiopseudomonas alkaliphila]|uniref:Lysozyme n=1 Tax=Thiopseudomonas alkaliphila TaxID=1697053 RepID=A0AAW7DTV7_9GAMM|nr:hypothetical protein [Thiopseudomonas alkaliphila]MDM1697082.1 hypothetical protein [Thiopseudomonas alkaliphila]